MRIISLLASGTELVHALGLGESLVGRSHECDWPESVKCLPMCTASTFDIGGTSRQIHNRVSEKLRAGDPLYTVDAEMIHRLKPDVIITQAHCEVCAVSPGDLERADCNLAFDAKVVASQIGGLENVLSGFVQVAEALNCRFAGE